MSVSGYPFSALIWGEAGWMNQGSGGAGAGHKCKCRRKEWKALGQAAGGKGKDTVSVVSVAQAGVMVTKHDCSLAAGVVQSDMPSP